MVIEYDDGVAAMSQPSSRQRVTSKSLGQPPQPPQPGSSAAASLGVRIAMIASVSLPVPPRHRLQACRSEERRAGKECVSPCRSRCSPHHHQPTPTPPPPSTPSPPPPPHPPPPPPPTPH